MSECLFYRDEYEIGREKTHKVLEQSFQQYKKSLEKKEMDRADKYRKRIAVFSPNYSVLNSGQINVKKAVFPILDDLVSKGASTLITRLDYGADTAAAEKFAEMKAQNPELRILCMVPYKGWRSTDYFGYLNFVNTFLPKYVDAVITVGETCDSNFIDARDMNALDQSFYHIFVLPKNSEENQECAYTNNLLDYSMDHKRKNMPNNTVYLEV